MKISNEKMAIIQIEEWIKTTEEETITPILKVLDILIDKVKKLEKEVSYLKAGKYETYNLNKIFDNYKGEINE